MGGRGKQKPKLKIPYYPSNDDDKGHYTVHSFDFKVVSDYLKISLLDVDELSLDDYMLYLRDAFIYNYSQTEQGREYLDKCWTLEQTKSDASALRKKFGK